MISHKLLGTNEWFVIHHTNCGMELFTDEVMRGLLAESLHTASVNETEWLQAPAQGLARPRDATSTG
ncbi:MAG: hypothetical protein U5K74_02225 [Gemmatimonadaceae bacterium]|nr:hypothetical protein [Gemmatimonadaceae bacterium]